MDNKKSYDLVVIGAGSAGLVAASCGMQKGLKVALLEKTIIGGDCTHYGCIPSKSLLNSVKVYQNTKHLVTRAGIHGLTVSGQPDFAKVMEHVNAIVQDIYEGETPEVFRKKGIDTYIHEEGGKFIDKHSVSIGPDVLHFKFALICTGSSPAKLEAPGIETVEVLNNENFWNLRKLPESILFIGGGAISSELGQALARLGSKVTILDNFHRILRPVEDEVAKVMIDIFENEGINLIGAASINRFSKAGNYTLVNYSQGNIEKSIEAEKIFISIGRRANVKGLNLENAGVEYSERGVVTNKYLQTSTENIYACGDITAPYKFTHTASYQSNIAVDNMLGNLKENDLSVFPWAIFTDPEIAHVGLTEAEAREKYGNKITAFRVDANIDRFMTDKNSAGFLKVIFDENDLVLGADAVGVHAAEWMHLITMAIKCRIPASKFLDIIFIYPTYSKIVKKVFTRYLKSKL